MAAHQDGSEANPSQNLKHGLQSRHLTMISIAGVIGGSLFVGSGSIIYNTVHFRLMRTERLVVGLVSRLVGYIGVL